MRLFLFLFFIFLSFHGNAQQNNPTTLRKELSINALNILVFKTLDFTYEIHLNEESSFGLNTFLSLDGKSRFDKDAPYYYEAFTLTPFYRIYFSEKENAGFFVEAFATYATGSYDDSQVNVYNDFNELAIGFSLGKKFITKRNFVAVIYAGAGRYMLENENAPGVVPRIGISFGKRF